MKKPLGLLVLVLTVLSGGWQRGVAQDNTFLPANLQPITRDNVGQLEKVASLGQGILVGAGLIDDGATLVAVSTTAIYFYETANLSAPPRVVPYIAGHPFEARPGITYVNPDVQIGEQISVAFDGTRLIVDPATGEQEVAVAETVGERILSPDSTVIAESASIDTQEATVQIVDAATGNVLAIIEQGTGFIAGAGFGADGQSLFLLARLAENRKYLQQWDWANGTLVASVEITENIRPGTLFEVGPARIVIGTETSVLLYSPTDLHEITRYETGELLAAVSPDGQVLALLDGEDQLQVLAIETGETIYDMDMADIACGRLTAQNLFLNMDGTRLYLSTGVFGGTITQIDMANNSFRTVGGFGLDISDLAFSDDTLAVAATISDPSCVGRNPGSGVQLYDLQSGAATGLIVNHAMNQGLALGPSGLVAVAGERKAELFAAGQLVNSITRDDYSLYFSGAAISTDGTYVAAYNYSGVYVWRTDNFAPGAEIVVLPGEPDFWGRNLIFDGHILIYIDGQAVRFYDLDAGIETAVWDYEHHVVGLAFAPDKRRLAVQTDNNRMLEAESERLAAVEVWQLGETPQMVTTFPFAFEHEMMSFNPDGTLLIGATKNGDFSISYITAPVVIYDTQLGELAGTLSDRLLFRPAIFSPDGRLIAITAGRGIVELWGVRGQ